MNSSSGFAWVDAITIENIIKCKTSTLILLNKLVTLKSTMSSFVFRNNQKCFINYELILTEWNGKIKSCFLKQNQDLSLC